MSSSLSSMRPSLLSAAAGGTAPTSRSATAAVAKAAHGFHLFHIDGYSLTTSLPGGERISSESFSIGGRNWCVDYYPNGVDDSTDSDAIALYLRLHGTGRKERVRAEFKFSVLDSAGNAAYELPAERGIFVSTGGYGSDRSDEDDEASAGKKKNKPSSCGYEAFITKDDLGRQRESLVREDSLAIRCDVGVAEVETVAVGRVGQWRRKRNTRRRRPSYISDSPESPDEDDGSSSHGGRRGQPPPADDNEYIRRCLAASCKRRK